MLLLVAQFIVYSSASASIRRLSDALDDCDEFRVRRISSSNELIKREEASKEKSEGREGIVRREEMREAEEEAEEGEIGG